MKQIRNHLYLITTIFIFLLIIGSFVDLELSQAIANKNNGYALATSAFGTIPGYGCFAFLAGGFISLGLNKKYQLWPRIALFAFALFGVIASIYFAGNDFSSCAFNDEHSIWGYIIVFPFMIGITFFGYWLLRNSDNNKLWLLLLIISITLFMALVPGVTMLKHIFHRPRYRSLAPDLGLRFHEWWERCTDYQSYKTILHLGEDEFKSFPSGHAGSCACVMVVATFLPLMNKKYEKNQLPILYIGLGWTALICLSRILAGAHFLSDVSVGVSLTTVTLIIANEIVIYLRKRNVLPK